MILNILLLTKNNINSSNMVNDVVMDPDIPQV